jgi:hypothetical protein
MFDLIAIELLCDYDLSIGQRSFISLVENIECICSCCLLSVSHYIIFTIIPVKTDHIFSNLICMVGNGGCIGHLLASQAVCLYNYGTDPPACTEQHSYSKIRCNHGAKTTSLSCYNAPFIY